MNDELLDHMAEVVAAEGTSGLWTPDKVVALCRRVVALKTEVARLSAGWEKANGRVLEVGLERSAAEERVAELQKVAGNTDGECRCALRSAMLLHVSSILTGNDTGLDSSDARHTVVLEEARRLVERVAELEGRLTAINEFHEACREATHGGDGHDEGT